MTTGDIGAFAALLGFVVLMVGTPGPANMVIMLAGAQNGMRRTVGFILGVIVGFAVINILSGFGLGQFLKDSPAILFGLKIISASVMIWFAIQSWTPAAGANPGGTGVYSFKTGLIVHPVNPKAWVMLILGWTEFAPSLGSFPVQLVAMIAAFAGVGLVVHAGYAFAGVLSGRVFGSSLLLNRTLVIITVLVVLAALTL